VVPSAGPPGVAARKPAPPSNAPAPAADEEAPEKEGDKEAGGEKRPKGPKDLHPTRKRVFPGSPDFGMDVLGTRVGGTRRGIRRIESPRPRDGGGAPAAAAAEPRVVAVSLPITLKDLSAAIGVKATAIIGKLMQAGQMATMNDYLNEE